MITTVHFGATPAFLGSDIFCSLEKEASDGVSVTART